MKESFHDFDAQFAEMRERKLRFRLFGEIHEFPRRVPAHLVLEVARREADSALDLPFLARAGGEIFGQETIARLLRRSDFTTEMLAEMIRWAFGAAEGESPREELTEDGVGPG